MLQDFRLFLLQLLKGVGGLFPHSVICCGLEDNIPRLLSNTLCLEYNHQIIGSGFLYFDRCNGELCYCIDVFSLGSRRDLGGGNTYLYFGGKFGRDDGK